VVARWESYGIVAKTVVSGKCTAPAQSDGHNVFTTLAKPCESYWLQQGLLTCGKKIKCHSEKFLQTFLGLLSLVVPGPL